MNVMMMTNTYTPFIGGVERSIEMFTKELRGRGHNVIVVAPVFPDMPSEEEGVIRVPAIQRFNGTDFSVPLPVPGALEETFHTFRPQIVHTHHPYLIGDTALRVAARFEAPVVFTFHTFYERYTHYAPGDSSALRRFVASLATGFCNLSDHIIAPSNSVREELVRRGVKRPSSVIPTGIDVKKFGTGDGHAFRKEFDIPEDAFVVGFVSRIAPEKNVQFLAHAVADFLSQTENTYFLLIGHGTSLPSAREVFHRQGLQDRLRAPGPIQGSELVDAYHAMDLFAFASVTETQGMVMTEALASGCPLVVLDAPGNRDVIEHEKNGFLVKDENKKDFTGALNRYYELQEHAKAAFRKRAISSAEKFDKSASVDKLENIYKHLVQCRRVSKETKGSSWDEAKHWIKKEWDVLSNMASATAEAFSSEKKE